MSRKFSKNILRWLRAGEKIQESSKESECVRFERRAQHPEMEEKLKFERPLEVHGQQQYRSSSGWLMCAHTIPDSRDTHFRTNQKLCISQSFKLHTTSKENTEQVTTSITDSQLLKSNIKTGAIVSTPPGITDGIKLEGIDHNQLQYCIHHQPPPHRNTQVVPVPTK